MGVQGYLRELSKMVDKGGPEIFDYDRLRIILILFMVMISIR